MVELFGGDPLTFDRAAALLDDPRQHAGGAEDVTARGSERILQNFITQVAFEVWVHSPLETIQLKAHFLNKKMENPKRNRDSHRIAQGFDRSSD